MERLINKINEKLQVTRNNELLRAFQRHCHRLFFGKHSFSLLMKLNLPAFLHVMIKMTLQGGLEM